MKQLWRQKSQSWKLLGVGLAAAMMVWTAAGPPPVVGAAASQRELPIYCVQKDYKVVSLSFDAAWGNGRVRQTDPASEVGGSAKR